MEPFSRDPFHLVIYAVAVLYGSVWVILEILMVYGIYKVYQLLKKKLSSEP